MGVELGKGALHLHILPLVAHTPRSAREEDPGRNPGGQTGTARRFDDRFAAGTLRPPICDLAHRP